MLSFKKQVGMLAKALFAVILAFAFIQPASALVITEDATARGWIEQSGRPFGGDADSNYIVGNCGFNDCRVGEYRPWFEFEIPSFAGMLTSAVLLIDSESVQLFQGPSLTVNFASLDPGFEFAEIGNGNLYATRTYRATDEEVEGVAISLSAEALTDIADNMGASFLIGARASSGAEFGGQLPNQLVFGNSGGRVAGSTRLQLTISDPSPMPLGSTMVLLLLGIAGVSASRKKAHSDDRRGFNH
ncbi:MAG: hypothetical protein AB8C02_11490 [Halioglobus sp.]